MQDWYARDWDGEELEYLRAFQQKAREPQWIVLEGTEVFGTFASVEAAQTLADRLNARVIEITSPPNP